MHQLTNFRQNWPICSRVTTIHPHGHLLPSWDLTGSGFQPFGSLYGPIKHRYAKFQHIGEKMLAQSSVLNKFVLYSEHAAPFQNDGDSKATGVENQGHLTLCKK